MELHSIRNPLFRYWNLLRLSDTNWACRFFTVHAISHHLPAVLRVVKEITEEPNSETAVDATDQKVQFDFDDLQSCWHCLTSSRGIKSSFWHFSDYNCWVGWGNRCYCWFKRYAHNEDSNRRIKYNLRWCIGANNDENITRRARHSI